MWLDITAGHWTELEHWIEEREQGASLCDLSPRVQLTFYSFCNFFALWNQMKATAFFLLQVAFTLCTFCAFMLLQKVKQMFIKIVTLFFYRH